MIKGLDFTEWRMKNRIMATILDSETIDYYFVKCANFIEYKKF